MATILRSGSVGCFSFWQGIIFGRLNTQWQSIILVNQAEAFHWRTDTVNDKVHPNASGAKKMAQKWIDALLPLLEKKDANKTLKVTR